MSRIPSLLFAAALCAAGCSTADRSRDNYPAATPTIIHVHDAPAATTAPAPQATDWGGPARAPDDRRAPMPPFDRADAGADPTPGRNAPNGSSNAKPDGSARRPSAPEAPMPNPTDVKHNGDSIDTTHGPTPPPQVIPDAGAKPL